MAVTPDGRVDALKQMPDRQQRIPSTRPTEDRPFPSIWCCSYMQVSMAVTPDGRADAVKQMPDDGQQVFALPATERRPFSDFLEAVITPEPGEIVYAQSQNNR